MKDILVNIVIVVTVPVIIAIGSFFILSGVYWLVCWALEVYEVMAAQGHSGIFCYCRDF